MVSYSSPALNLRRCLLKRRFLPSRIALVRTGSIECTMMNSNSGNGQNAPPPTALPKEEGGRRDEPSSLASPSSELLHPESNTHHDCESLRTPCPLVGIKPPFIQNTTGWFGVNVIRTLPIKNTTRRCRLEPHNRWSSQRTSPVSSASTTRTNKDYLSSHVQHIH